MSTNVALVSLAKAILSGEESEATTALDSALAAGISINEVVKGVSSRHGMTSALGMRRTKALR